MGTPGYMSPEQQEDASKVTPISDIYALGKILRECFTGLSPIEEFQLEVKEFSEKKSHKPKKHPTNLPLDIKAIVEKAIQGLPQNRYQKVSELVQEIERYRNNQLILARQHNFWDFLEFRPEKT